MSILKRIKLVLRALSPAELDEEEKTVIYKNIRCWLTTEDEPRLMWEELPYAVWLSWERHAEVIYKVWRTGTCYSILSNDDVTKAGAEFIANSYEKGEVRVTEINLRSDAP